MKKVYICSPYRAKDGAELDRNIDYAQQLTRQALNSGYAPVTPHLYMTQCLDEDKPEERARGMAAGLALLKSCDFVLLGNKYGISEGMNAEIRTAKAEGMEVVNADKLSLYIRCMERREKNKAHLYAKLHACNFCEGRHFHTCTGFDCREPYTKAYEYALQYPFCI